MSNNFPEVASIVVVIVMPGTFQDAVKKAMQARKINTQ